MRHTVHGRRPLDEKKKCHLCLQDTSNVTPAKIYTRKGLVTMETSIADFHTSFYITAIQNITFHIPHVRILGTNHCGNTQREAFKRCSANQDVLCCHDYDEIVVASFGHQIRSEYYDGNRYVSIEGIALEHFSAPTYTEIAGTPQSCTRHAMSH